MTSQLWIRLFTCHTFIVITIMYNHLGLKQSGLCTPYNYKGHNNTMDYIIMNLSQFRLSTATQNLFIYYLLSNLYIIRLEFTLGVQYILLYSIVIGLLYLLILSKNVIGHNLCGNWVLDSSFRGTTCLDLA